MNSATEVSQESVELLDLFKKQTTFNSLCKSRDMIMYCARRPCPLGQSL